MLLYFSNKDIYLANKCHYKYSISKILMILFSRDHIHDQKLT